ncbi:MAG: hypothetical protein GX241_03075 [Ruminococcaceae bacterium]|nr:hypothetical protein [Oscillospiraceae bacterium]
MKIFKFKNLNEHICLVKELISTSFLIKGEDATILLGTGMGVFNLKKHIAKKYDNDLIVVNSHFLPFHSGGNFRFQEVHIGENDLPTFTKKDEYFKLLDILPSVYKENKKLILLKPLIDKVLKVKKGKTKYEPLKDGDVIDLGDRDIIVKDFPGHTQGSITLLDEKKKIIYSGDSCSMGFLFFTNPAAKTSEYRETALEYYSEVKKLGYKKMYSSFISYIPFPNRISFIRDFGKWIGQLTPEQAKIKINVPGAESELCIAIKSSIRHLMFICAYWEHQCE